MTGTWKAFASKTLPDQILMNLYYRSSMTDWVKTKLNSCRLDGISLTIHCVIIYFIKNYKFWTNRTWIKFFILILTLNLMQSRVKDVQIRPLASLDISVWIQTMRLWIFAPKKFIVLLNLLPSLLHPQKTELIYLPKLERIFGHEFLIMFSL